MCMSSLGDVLNPIGVVARKIGGPVGALLDPVGAIGKKIGGPVGQIIDPASAFRPPAAPEEPKPVRAQTQRNTGLQIAGLGGGS